MDFSLGDTVLYGVHGVCKIASMEEKTMGGETRAYYVLKPVYEENSTVYIPVDNEALKAKLKRILSPEEIYALIRSMPEEDSIWVEDEAQRKDRYQKILAKGDRAELIRLIKTLYLHSQSQTEKRKKLHISDEHFMKEAEKMLYEEFAHVLCISREQVLPFIMEQIQLGEMAG